MWINGAGPILWRRSWAEPDPQALQVVDEGLWLNGTGFELAKKLGMYEPQPGDDAYEGEGGDGGEEGGEESGGEGIPKKTEEEEDVRRMVQAIYDKRDRQAREEFEEDNPFDKNW